MGFPRYLAACAFLPFLLPHAGSAQTAIRSNTGFRNELITRGNDDTGFGALGFTVNFFGRQRSGAYITTNGAISLDAPIERYSPDRLEGLRREVIAAFWADVDTRGPQSNAITFGRDTIDGRRAFGVNYLDVGYFEASDDKRNRFQIVLIEREDTGAGNFDIEFNYERILWEAGSSAGGVNGLGGITARVGFSAGTGAGGSTYELPGSGVIGAFLDGRPGALNRQMLNSNVPGRVVLQIRGGSLVQSLFTETNALSFEYTTGNPPPPARTFRVTSTSPGVGLRLSSNAIWAAATADSAVTPANVRVSVDPGTLLPGVYNAMVTVTPDAGSGLSPSNVAVRLQITGQGGAPPATCAYVLNPPSLNLIGVNSTVALDVRAPAGCNWEARSNVDWITIGAPGRGSGDGFVTLLIQANGGGPRAGSLTIAGLNVAVVQSPFVAGGTLNANCVLTTVAGTGGAAFSQDGIQGAQAPLNNPTQVIVDRAGFPYIVDAGNFRIRRINAEGVIETVAGNGFDGFTGDGGPATAAPMVPSSVAIDPAGDLYLTDSKYHLVRRVRAADGVIERYAGTSERGNSGVGVPALTATMDTPRGIAADRAGNVYVADTGNHQIRRIDASRAISGFAGSGSPGFDGDFGPALQARLQAPRRVTVDPRGNVYIAEPENNRIRMVTPQGRISTFAGNGLRGSSGDGGPAGNAQLAEPVDVAADNLGNVYIAEAASHRVRRVNTFGIIEQVAGRGQPGFSPDGTRSFEAALNNPVGVAADLAGNVYIVDAGNQRVRKVSCPLGGAAGPRITSVVNGASFAAPVSPAAFLTITGEGLAATTTTWDNAIGADGRLPRELAGVAVRVNGQPAYVNYVSPTQINVVAPSSLGAAVAGTVAVEVSTAQGSAISVAPVQPVNPALFAYSAGGRRFAAANFAADNRPVEASRPARAGDNLVLYGTGFGRTEAPEGQVLTQPYPLLDAAQARATIGGVPARVQFVGLVFAGVFQVNLQVPEGVNAGNQPVVIEVPGGGTQRDLAIPIAP